MSSYGQTLLGDYLSALIGKHPAVDVHPSCIDNAELDLFWPDLDLAVEFQGHGHFAPIFGNRAFRRQQYNDRRKMLACEENGIVLCRIDISGLRHPQVPEGMLRRFISCYGRDVGARRFFSIVGERPFTRADLFAFNPRFDTYRRTQISYESWRPSPGSAKQRRLLRNSLGA